MAYTTPTTLLEAVNEVLRGIGEAPVSQIGTGVIDAENAEAYINSNTRALLARGWHFNRETEFPLVPDVDGHVRLPVSCLEADVPVRTSNKYVQRGTRFYDTENHTYNIGETLYANMTILLPFEDLPEAARRYVVAKSKRIMQAEALGDNSLLEIQTQDEQEAWAALHAAELRNADVSIFNNPDLDYMRRR